MRIRPIHFLYALAIVMASFFIVLWGLDYFLPLCPQGDRTALRGPFSKQGTFSFFATVPALADSSDTPEAPKRSPYLICEDDRPLGASSLHADIRQLGGGRYSIWGNFLYFSSSDNSDPRTNGRVYRLGDAGL